MGKIGRVFAEAVLAAALAVCLGGCMSESSKIISYMEERYGNTFTYAGETNGIFGNRAFTARLTCPDYPDDVILASCVEQEEDGKEVYADNYMAVRYHDGAFQKIDEAAGQVFEDYRLFFRVPDVLMRIEEPEQYTLEDYLADPDAFKSVRILTGKDVDEKTFQALMNAFEDAGISVKGLVAVPVNPSELETIGEKDVDSFLAGWDRVRAQVNFNLRNGTLIDEKWRQ